MIEDNLKKLGFTANEVKIYLAILRLGKTKAGEILKETGLQRSVDAVGKISNPMKDFIYTWSQFFKYNPPIGIKA